MKKIVALALSLVMVLGLATVAFADTQDIKVADVKLTNAAGVTLDLSAATGFVKTTEAKNTTTSGATSTTTVVPAYYTLTHPTWSGANTFVECDKSIADYVLTIKNVGSVYVKNMAVPAAFKADVATAYTAPKTATCGMVGADEDTYYVIDGKYYKADVTGAKYALLNGKMVICDATAVTAKDHAWATATKESFDAKTGAVTSVKCPDCKGVVAVYTKAGSFDGNEYKLITEGVAANMFYVVGAAAVEAPAAGSTVESAKTFDAGIAMYVGMSVMAAAGSAVVLKKKD